jgi:hypothetical protein
MSRILVIYQTYALFVDILVLLLRVVYEQKCMNDVDVIVNIYIYYYI